MNIEVPPPSAIIEPEPSVPETPAAEGLDPAAKKIRNLSKKVCVSALRILGLS